MSAPSSSQPSVLKTEQEIVETYNRLRQDQSTLMSRIAEIESERQEHALVIDTLTTMEQSRRCHRLVGGVLVQRNVGEVLPELQSSLKSIDVVLNQFSDQLIKKEKDMENFMVQYKITARGDNKQQQAQGGAESKSGDNRGVLA